MDGESTSNGDSDLGAAYKALPEADLPYGLNPEDVVYLEAPDTPVSEIIPKAFNRTEEELEAHRDLLAKRIDIKEALIKMTSEPVALLTVGPEYKSRHFGHLREQALAELEIQMSRERLFQDPPPDA
jgi:hypothetical protein